jgi:hypothetical protein
LSPEQVRKFTKGVLALYAAITSAKEAEDATHNE